MSFWIQIVSAFLAAFFFSLLFNQPNGTHCISAAIAAVGYALFLVMEQTTLAYFCAALLISIACEICARLLKKVATMFTTSALIPLVPGLGLYRTIRCLVEQSWEQAAQLGVNTLMGIFAIALAITFSALLFANLHKLSKHS